MCLYVQVEMHPYLPQSALLEFCQSLGVKVVAFSPLGSSSYVELGQCVGCKLLVCDFVLVYYKVHILLK